MPMKLVKKELNLDSKAPLSEKMDKVIGFLSKNSGYCCVCCKRLIGGPTEAVMLSESMFNMLVGHYERAVKLSRGAVPKEDFQRVTQELQIQKNLNRSLLEELKREKGEDATLSIEGWDEMQESLLEGI